jgi:ABC-2 type transport system permease protein
VTAVPAQQSTDIAGRVMGPSALAGGLRRFAIVTITMAVLEFRLRFFGSVLGYLWQLMRPLLLFGVLYVVFTQAFPLGSGIDFYPVVLLSGIVLFTFFSDATATAVGSLLDRESILRKVHFPRLAIPASVVLTSSFTLLLNLVAVGVFAAIAGVKARWTWLEMPLLIAFLAAFAFGLAMLLSALFVRYRDIRPIWDVVLQITFYASPVLYVVERIQVKEIKTLMLHLNPLAPVLQQVRHAVVDPAAPSAAAAMGGKIHLLAPIGIVGATLAIGAIVFVRAAPRVAEEL